MADATPLILDVDTGVDDALAIGLAVSRPDVDPLRSAVHEGDPVAFLVIGHGHQATGGVLRKSATGD